jgi:very-short-patch-repair endonuclease
VAEHADGRAANPFESVLRSVALEVPGLVLVPQVIVAESPELRPDLVDPVRRVVAEADSFAWHGSRSALRRDCRRYNRLALLDYVVLRFSWEDVMHDPGYVRAVLVDTVRVVEARAQRAVRRRKTA